MGYMRLSCAAPGAGFWWPLWVIPSSGYSMKIGKAMDTALLHPCCFCRKKEGIAIKAWQNSPGWHTCHPPSGGLGTPSSGWMQPFLCISLSEGDFYSDSASFHLVPCCNCLLNAASEVKASITDSLTSPPAAPLALYLPQPSSCARS